MGWGTFIAGQTIRNARRAGRSSTSALDAFSDLAEQAADRRAIFENEVLREIERRNAQGVPIDIVEIRAYLRRIRRAYKKLGPQLDMKVLRIAQQRAIAGEPVDKDQIEFEIVEAYKPYPWGKALISFPWGKASLWLFIPFIPIGQFLIRKFQESANSAE